ncbi:MAG: hypothetical protein GY842_18570 [bacterium]|nr:hypothetical protein [bacterium]
MPVIVDENFESRMVTTGQGPSIELRYTVRGTNSQTEATAAMGPASPDLYDPYGSGIIFYPRQSVTVQPIGDELWEAGAVL